MELVGREPRDAIDSDRRYSCHLMLGQCRLLILAEAARQVALVGSHQARWTERLRTRVPAPVYQNLE